MIVCSSHGLFCFHDSFSPPNQSQTKRAVIWNPTIGKSVDIYMPNVLDTPSHCKTVIGFWGCPRTCDAKLVKITLPMPWGTISKRVEVFTLKTGFWRSSRSNSLPRQSVMFNRKQVVIDEFIYWLAEDFFCVDGRLQNPYLIISFDMISEEFVELHLPESIKRSGSCLCISKLKESLVVAATSGSNLPVWIMQNGDPKSFTPIFTINSPNTPIRDLLGFTESGEPVFVKETKLNEDELFVYEPNSKQIKSTGIFGALNSFSLCSYAETLLVRDH
nr:hypothetical protein [Tanacetum cinerariifolium]